MEQSHPGWIVEDQNYSIGSDCKTLWRDVGSIVGEKTVIVTAVYAMAISINISATSVTMPVFLWIRGQRGTVPHPAPMEILQPIGTPPAIKPSAIDAQDGQSHNEHDCHDSASESKFLYGQAH